MAKILLPAGGRAGFAKMGNESGFRDRINAGDEVFTELNGVCFSVTLVDDVVRYTALLKKPDGLDHF